MLPALSAEQLLKNLVDAIDARTEADRQIATAHGDAVLYFSDKARKDRAGWDGTLPTWPKPASTEAAEFGAKVDPHNLPSMLTHEEYEALCVELGGQVQTGRITVRECRRRIVEAARRVLEHEKASAASASPAVQVIDAECA